MGKHICECGFSCRKIYYFRNHKTICSHGQIKPKHCVIFFNCHGDQIYNQLKSSKTFMSIYNVYIISLYNYLPPHQYSTNEELIDEHKNYLKKCDLCILQYIKNDRKIIHHENIKSILKPECIVITIPHYTFSGYHYPYNIVEDIYINENCSKDELEYYTDNLLIDKKEEIQEHLESELNHINELDQCSDIKCYYFIKNNYNKTWLFYERSYPTFVLFHYISQEILKLVNIYDKTTPCCIIYHGSEIAEKIFPCVKKYLNLEFNIKFTFDCNLLEYIICCKRLKKNLLYFYKGNTDECNNIINIIASKKYR
jgi:hypothetical protein